MLNKQKTIEQAETKRRQQMNSRLMRKKSAQYQHYLTSGEADVNISIPASDLRQVAVPAKTSEGFEITIKVWQAKFGDESVRRIERKDAAQWIRVKRQLWESGEMVLRDRAVARAKMVRLHSKMSLIASEIQESVSEETNMLVMDAMSLMNIAIQTITESGQQKTIAEVGRGE